MKYRSTFLWLLAAGLALSSLGGIATQGYGAKALHAQSAGFDALADEILGGSASDSARPDTEEGMGAQ